MDKTECPVCGYKEVEKVKKYDPMTMFYSCPVCGRYEITEIETMNPSLDRRKLNAYLFYKRYLITDHLLPEYRYHTTVSKEKCDVYKEEFRQGDQKHGLPVHMDNEIITLWYPKTFAEKIDMILLKLDELTDYVGQELNLLLQEIYGLCFVNLYDKNGKTKHSENEMNQQIFFYGRYLCDAGYIEGAFNHNSEKAGPIKITPKGYERIDQLQKHYGDGRDVLVAMKFGDDTNELSESIREGVKNAGYEAKFIDEVEHNDLITPELLSYIKRSKFVVVDLTHQNNGAYFEEGYAMGIGKPVIQLCKKGVTLHFDIAQINTIFWDTESDIPLRLTNRIRATID